ncbi:nitroreductase/quinone reductase family protein [Actinomadura atramentaria]|uniref:nitroreductase/quinone reductase family protein n=1 Tax=Actinomadura atramentaria TaxID=1990 RepID=UPI00037CA3DF|nr:nitroreductase/quinone reductase family protein [Actinomadura atramentaria]
MADWNTAVIAEFRANGGRVGGGFAGVPLVLLTTAGRVSGRPHVTPAVYRRDRDRYLVFASNAGADDHPDWYKNLLASAQVTVEIGDGDGGVGVHSMVARFLDGPERDREWERQCAIDPGFREYERKTSRTIPVVALIPLDLSGDAGRARARAVAEQLGAIHATLRAELADVRARLASAAAGPPAPDLASQLRRHCLKYCFDLQLHHTREDGAFTEFERRFPALAPAIARLRDEHRAVEKALAAFEDFLRGDDLDPDHVRTELDRVAADLEDHFAREEQALLAATAD